MELDTLSHPTYEEKIALAIDGWWQRRRLTYNVIEQFIYHWVTAADHPGKGASEKSGQSPEPKRASAAARTGPSAASGASRAAEIRETEPGRDRRTTGEPTTGTWRPIRRTAETEAAAAAASEPGGRVWPEDLPGHWRHGQRRLAGTASAGWSRFPAWLRTGWWSTSWSLLSSPLSAVSGSIRGQARIKSATPRWWIINLDQFFDSKVQIRRRSVEFKNVLRL